ncbi:MAG TPA: hypothetical protein VFO46_00660 [Candidatus Sulfotelmatobacter sp.]|nr:hypothetical protein [Candidatus Sulfotelmatobacter sp.]
MTNKWSRLLFVVVLVGLTSVWALAQDQNNDANNSANKGEVRNITGCLTKSGGGNEYLLTANDGSTWEIRENSSVDLAAHVNQTVEAKGVVAHEKMHNMKEDSKEMAHDTGATKAKAEHGHLKVTDVHKVSDSCSQ